ncbi:hypothetical protein HanLR1_Chr12g0428381 [Helianthus annuus]|nr:hypothetical protein HanHA89_Chr12g0451211 [Helianthus annuus]KAJ0673359.1 hypothetical protein HanLR1_Chr12g0428381 [Helianthus annuus]
MGYFDISVDHVHGQKPHLVIFVMDSSIDQAAFDKAKAFKRSQLEDSWPKSKLESRVFSTRDPPATRSPTLVSLQTDFRLKMPTFFTRDPKTAAHGPTLVWYFCFSTRDLKTTLTAATCQLPVMKRLLLLHKLTRTSPEVYLIADQGSEFVNHLSPIPEKLDRFPLRSRMGPAPLHNQNVPDMLLESRMSQRLQQKMSQRPSAPQAVSLTAEQEKALRQQGSEVEPIRTEGWKLGAHQFQMKLKKQKNNLWFETVVDLCPLNLLILLKTLKKYT